MGDADALVTLLTSPGQGGISVISLAGPKALAVLGPLFRSPRGRSLATAAPGALLYGTLVRDGEILDEVVVCRSPDGSRPGPTYEINCHGGHLPARRVIAALVDLGAREATWSALLDAKRRSGDLDTVQSEAAILLPNAITPAAARMLLAQQRGALSRSAGEILRMLGGGPDEARRRLRHILGGSRYGRRLVSPARVGVAGRPNVGKSSLINAMLRHDRVIVHAKAGTTRDVIEEKCCLAGAPVTLVDMAGVRETSDEVERAGVRRARETVFAVDLVVLVIDASQPISDEDHDLIEMTADRERIVVLNKTDLPAAVAPGDLPEPPAEAPFRVSALTGAGLPELENAIAAKASGPAPDLDGPVPFTERQEQLLEQACQALRQSHLGAGVAREALDQLLRGPLGSQCQKTPDD